ncbi:hypothetical protein LX36DRAFT_658942 [Colletotrichum falcatum]|nr:hypothetical protein LX36DRAFT_658942 [Colletotrichum falcatum]
MPCLLVLVTWAVYPNYKAGTKIASPTYVLQPMYSTPPRALSHHQQNVPLRPHLFSLVLSASGSLVLSRPAILLPANLPCC